MHRIMMRLALVFTVMLMLGNIGFCAGAGSSTGLGLEFEQMAGARAGGMAQAVSAMEGDISLMHYNPAGIIAVMKPELSFAYMLGFGDMNFANVAYGQPFMRGVLGISLSYFNAGNIELSGTQIADQVINAQSDLIFSGSFAKVIIEDMPLGATIKIFSSSIVQQPAIYACVFDFGAIYHTPLEGLNAGLAFQNLGTKITYYQTAENLPSNMRLGISYGLPVSSDMTALVNLEIKYLLNEATNIIGIGGEFKYARALTFRVGYAIGTAQNLTLGIGFNLDNYIIDYAFELARDIAAFGNHRIGLRMQL